MVKEIMDCPSKNKRKKDTHREITLEFEYNNENDVALMKKIEQLLNEQPRCNNCINFYHGATFCGYSACECKIYGILEIPSNPHYDGDGSKCKDYSRKI
jgi:hypothetical protein